MRKFAVFTITFLSVLALLWANTSHAETREIEAAKIPLQNFIRSLETNNVELIKRAFHSEGSVKYIYDSKLRTISFSKYIADFPKEPSPDEPKRKRRIESVEVTGNVAVGKLILEYPDVKFTDYLTMMKIGGEWKIVNKASNMEFPEKSK